MRQIYRAPILIAVILCLAWPAMAQSAKGPAPAAPKVDAKTIKALDDAMTPGEGQKRLNAMAGTFDVAIKTWVDPSKPPVESSATCVNAWVLDNRYVQVMLSGFVAGEPFNGIGYMGYDNASKTYEACWLDTGSTGMVWYRGGFDATSKKAIMKGSVTDPVTGKPTPMELHVTIDEKGNHLTELWGMGLGDKMFKMMELKYTRKGS